MESSIKFALSILEKAISTSCPASRGDTIQEFCSLVDNFDPKCRSALVDSSLLHEKLNQLILTFGFIPEFTDREYTSYDKSDFKNYDISSRALLRCAVSYILLVKSQQLVYEIDCEAQRNTSSSSPLQQSEKSVDETNDSYKFSFEPRNYTLKILPNLLLLIGANIRNPVWSSEDCQSLSVQLLKCVCDLFDCQNLHDTFGFSDKIYRDKNESVKLKDKNILGYLFHRLEKPLSRSRWEKNPFLCEVFNWLIPNIRSTNLSNHLDQIMATSLNFIHSHETLNKLNGLLSLNHLIENASGEELRWYNRADVMYDTLKIQMYSKEEQVLDSVLQCIFQILRVLERNPLENSDKHHEMLSSLLRDTEMENLIVVRRILIVNLATFISECGVLCIQHLSKILHVIEIFLDIEDFPHEIARIQALQALENVIIVAWPRMLHHSERIVQILLKFMVNIETSKMQDSVKEQLISQITVCVKLLLKVNPCLSTNLEEVKQSETLSILKDFISSVFVDNL